MPAIFKTLRRKYLKENRVTRYAAYALGEVILVMIGILLAIQVNDYRKEAALQKEEQFYRQSLLRDFQATRVELIRVKDKSLAQFRAANRVLKDIYSDSIRISNIEFTDDLFTCMNYTRFSSNDQTIQEIMNSGNLDLIRDDSLRFHLVSWESRVEFTREFEELNKRSFLQLSDFLDVHVEMAALMYGTNSVDDESRSKISAMIHFRNLLAQRLISSESVMYEYEDLLTKLDRRIAELE